MNRRSFLALFGAGAIVGCQGGNSETTTIGETTASPTATAGAAPEPTTTSATATTPGPPEIQLVNPVARWTEFGDAAARAVESIGAGSTLPVAARYRIWIHDGTLDVTVQAKAYDDGKRVGFVRDQDEQLAEGAGYDQWEYVLEFNTAGWREGSYTGEFFIRDDVLNETTNAEWGVELVAPLAADEVSLTSLTVPDSITVGEQFSYTIYFANESQRSSSIVSPLSYRHNGGQWIPIDSMARLNIPAGEVVSWESTATFDRPGRHEYRLDAVDITWTIPVEGETTTDAR